MPDPIFYKDKPWIADLFGGVREVQAPGWYFYDETWTYCYGPFLSYDICSDRLDEYCCWIDTGEQPEWMSEQKRSGMTLMIPPGFGSPIRFGVNENSSRRSN